jgi:undecaprenyl-diphosphatase
VKQQALLEADARWSARLRIAERPGRLRKLAVILAHSGDSWFWLLGLALTWWWGNATWKSLALRYIGAIFVLAFVVMAIKFSVRRRRPEGDWGTIYRATDPHSFPSGHAARAALLAILTMAWGPLWLAALLLVWAPLVSLARVSMGVHYLSDVVVGAALGIAAGALGILIFP